MKQHYNISNTIIPQDKRASINDKILALIFKGNTQGITQEDIFNAYTGVGGLHGLNREDFANYYQYSQAKKEIEHGQFFTPHQICKNIVELVEPKADDTIADITCGMGNFFNYFTQENCYGADIDKKAIEVAKYLYPNANIKAEDFKYFKVESKVDYVIGNPPFNLKVTKSEKSSNGHWYNDYDVLSQFFFFEKASEIIKPAGLILAIVPESFLADEFFNKSHIQGIEESFDFIGQYKLDKTAFNQMGVKSFATKVMCWQRKSESTENRFYSNEFITYDQLKEKIKVCLTEKDKLKAKLMNELVRSRNENSEFEYKIKKYLFEIKSQPSLKKYLPKAISHLDKLKNQKCPNGMSHDEWYKKHRITEPMVLSYLKKMVQKQSYNPIDKIEFVKTNYGFKFKPYSEKTKKQLQKFNKTEWINNDITLGLDLDYDLLLPRHSKFIFNKIVNYSRQNTPINKLDKNDNVDQYLKEFSFLDKDLQICKFNEIQLTDLGRILQKDYSILAWQMGGGKTAAALSWAQFKPQRNTFVVSASLAINLTWTAFLQINNIPFVQVKTAKDIENIKKGDYVLLSFEFLTRFEKQLKKFVKMNSQKVNLIFDESDEITNASAKRTRAVLNVFRRVKRKILTTGTTTRNNIAELYSQLELLYNNSVNMISWADYYYIEERNKEDNSTYVTRKENKYFQKPFPPYYGQTMFKRCFNPSKGTVFGIQKQNQDLYNEEFLREIIEKTIITRKFKEIAGEKYKVENIKVSQEISEREVYRKIIKEFETIAGDYFTSTGNSRKDALLRIIRQLTLLIEATSTPQFFDFYSGSGIPNKAKKIFQICENNDEKVAIGCTSLKGTNWYFEQLQERFPFRQIFKIVGDVSFNKRKSIIKDFENTHNGILVCTQQSLKSSVNIPTCDIVIVESLQWNIPKIEQFYFRFIRYNSKNITRVIFINYEGTIETNLLALLMTKERLNDFVKTLEYKDNSDIYSEYDIDLDILNDLITKQKDEDGKINISWGEAATI
jgi:SAM-dependent methyltransferase